VIVNHLSLSFGINVDADGASGFVPTTADIEDRPNQVYFIVGVAAGAAVSSSC